MTFYFAQSDWKLRHELVRRFAVLSPLFFIFGYATLCLLLVVGGFSDWDDHSYVEAADGWLAHAPFIGTTHWHLRHPLVLAIAASFWLFGRSEAALMVPTILCYLGILFLTFRIVLPVT